MRIRVELFGTALEISVGPAAEEDESEKVPFGFSGAAQLITELSSDGPVWDDE